MNEQEIKMSEQLTKAAGEAVMEQVSDTRKVITGAEGERLERAAEAAAKAIHEIAAGDVMVGYCPGVGRMTQRILDFMEPAVTAAVEAATREAGEELGYRTRERDALERQLHGIADVEGIVQAYPGTMRRVCGVDRVMMAINQRKAELSAARQNLGNILARIFRDGGQRQAEIGDDAKAAEEAENIFLNLLAERDALRERVRVLEEALEMLWGFHCLPHMQFVRKFKLQPDQFGTLDACLEKARSALAAREE